MTRTSRRRRLGAGRSALSDAGGRRRARRRGGALRLRALSRSRAGAHGPEPPSVRQPRRRRARRRRAASRRAGRERRRRLRRRSRRLRHGGRGLRSRSKPGRKAGARSMSLSFPASPRCSPSRRGSARRSVTISARCRCPTISSRGTLIERRLDAAASAGFVIALYNPVSRARPWQFGNAIERLRRHLPPSDAGRVRPRRRTAGRTHQRRDARRRRRDARRHGDAGHRRLARDARHRAARPLAAGLHAARRRGGERMIEPGDRILDRLDRGSVGRAAAGAA